jgi:hypothetical protein
VFILFIDVKAICPTVCIIPDMRNLKSDLPESHTAAVVVGTNPRFTGGVLAYHELLPVAAR